MSKRLFVGNLSYNTTESDLQAAFEQFGCQSAVIPTDYDGRAKGFGFVEVDAEQMNNAISAMNGKDLGGRTLTVNEARPRPERTGGGGGGYGGGNRGGGGGYGGGGRSGGNRW
ncbi:MAG: RNA recognition motif domain-containing protein [Armatimonadota bacterium]